MKDPRIVVGENVRKYRLKAALSQEGLAELAELHRTYIGQVERGETNISLLNMKKIADALRVSPAALLSGV